MTRRVLEQLFGYERSPFYGEKLKADYQWVQLVSVLLIVGVKEILRTLMQ
jgi:hypothetical protein